MTLSIFSGCRGVLLASLCVLIKGRPDEFLKFENRTESIVKGCFHQNSSLTLCFEIRPGFLQLTDKKNRILVKYRKLPNHDQRFHAQVLDDNFVWHHSAAEPLFITTAKKTDAATADTELLFASDLSRNAGEISPSLYQSALAKLRSKQEIQLLARVSHALQSEVKRPEITKPFYVMSMSLLAEHNTNTSARNTETAHSDHLRYHNHRDDGRDDRKRADCKDLRSDPYHNKCLGMCGPKCWCWPLFCGDCCYHKGCYEHDRCCRHKEFSGYCLLPFLHHFRCESYGGYPACLEKH